MVSHRSPKLESHRPLLNCVIQQSLHIDCTSPINLLGPSQCSHLFRGPKRLSNWWIQLVTSVWRHLISTPPPSDPSIWTHWSLPAPIVFGPIHSWDGRDGSGRNPFCWSRLPGIFHHTQVLESKGTSLMHPRSPSRPQALLVPRLHLELWDWAHWGSPWYLRNCGWLTCWGKSGVNGKLFFDVSMPYRR